MSRTLSRTIQLTLVSELVSVAATTWITRRFATLYAEPEVDGYFVVRQVLGWVLSVGLFGLNVSLPRALAQDAGGSPRARRRQVLAALALAAPVLAVIALLALLVPRQAARLILYDAGAAWLFVAASGLFCANALFGVGAAALQGLDRFGLLALLRVIAWGAAPCVVVATLGGRLSLPALLALWGGAVFAIDALMLVVIASVLTPHASASSETLEPILPIARRLFHFGGLRMLGAIAQVSSVALAPTLVLWSGAAPRAAAALSVAAMFTMLLAPLRLALQPVALTQLAQLARSERGRRLAIDYCAVASCVSAAATAALVMSGDRLVELWLGQRYAAEALALRCSVVVIGLHFLCYTLEGALDPEDERNQRPCAQLGAAVVFMVGAGAACALHAGWPGILGAQLASALVQTALYVRILSARYGLPEARELIHGALTVGGGVVVAGLLGRLAGRGAGPTLLLLASQASATLLLVAMAQLAGVRWPALLLGRLGRPRRSGG